MGIAFKWLHYRSLYFGPIKVLVGQPWLSGLSAVLTVLLYCKVSHRAFAKVFNTSWSLGFRILANLRPQIRGALPRTGYQERGFRATSISYRYHHAEFVTSCFQSNWFRNFRSKRHSTHHCFKGAFCLILLEWDMFFPTTIRRCLVSCALGPPVRTSSSIITRRHHSFVIYIYIYIYCAHMYAFVNTYISTHV